MGYLFKPLFTAIIVLSLASCQKVELQKTVSNRPILQSFLIPGQKIKLSISKELMFGIDNSLEKLNNLSITLTSNDENETMSFIDSGRYVSNQIRVVENKTYKISFQFNGKTVSASTTVPSKPVGFSIAPLTLELLTTNTTSSLKLNWENKENDYYYISIKNTEKNPVSINNQNKDKTTESLTTQGNSDEIKSKNFSYLGAHQVILYHILPDYAVYYKDYNTTSSQVKQPPSNITNGLGIFSGLNADTVNIQVVK